MLKIKRQKEDYGNWKTVKHVDLVLKSTIAMLLLTDQRLPEKNW